MTTTDDDIFTLHVQKRRTSTNFRMDHSESIKLPLEQVTDDTNLRVRVDGKFFRLGREKWYLKGVTYGPFAPNAAGQFLPEQQQIDSDFQLIRKLGGNAIRVYHVPTKALLDSALRAGLRVLVDVPWQKHRCIFDDWAALQESRDLVRRAAKSIGNHLAVFAISVANEIPNDIVRYYGARRVQRHVDDLIDLVKQEAPECLATFANFPPTEFLRPARPDFHCFNLYLDNIENLNAYLDRLQHLAGPLPLILGEFGLDSRRKSVQAQADLLADQVTSVFHRGLAGSFIFSFTDDWFTGGAPVEDWEFGITDRQRREKPAAASLSRAWSNAIQISSEKFPKVSVVVCSYNGAATLADCLASLQTLRYPDYEVILVDDGSTDDTPQIATQFPLVRCIRQENLGLSAARNTGALAAAGDIVVYTDSDCVADEHWLHYLVLAMQEQKVAAIGGPNIPPPSDSWKAHCVAASPGGPSHVMLNDQVAEHIPGCNMAFSRDVLLNLGGFDPQFRQAGDDVDICWRLMDAGHKIGFAPAAVVWHHRRSTLRAYLKQQKGYGRAESMLHLKHPQRFNLLGAARWLGVIYGEGAVGLTSAKPVVFHGHFGSALFQTIYAGQQYGLSNYVMLLEWHMLATAFAIFSLILPPLIVVAALMWSITLVVALRAVGRAPLNSAVPLWCRPTVFLMHVIQPIIRGAQRHLHRLTQPRLPAIDADSSTVKKHTKTISLRLTDMYWTSNTSRGREHFLRELTATAHRIGWPGDFKSEWSTWDVQLNGDTLHRIQLRTATEELGNNHRFTRVRYAMKATAFSKVIGVACLIWTVTALLRRTETGIGIGLAALVAYAVAFTASRLRCHRAVSRLVRTAGKRAGLIAVLPSEYSTCSVNTKNHGTDASLPYQEIRA